MKTFWKNGQEAPSEEELEAGRMIKKKKTVFVLELFFFHLSKILMKGLISGLETFHFLFALYKITFNNWNRLFFFQLKTKIRQVFKIL